jgi:hypothetical protein
VDENGNPWPELVDNRGKQVCRLSEFAQEEEEEEEFIHNLNC